jgi:DNA-binding response OmpR family regulator
VLIVDDDRGLQRLWSRVLAKEGFAVTVASSANEAVEQLKQNTFDVIFTDYWMPGMSGRDLVVYFRRQNMPGCINILTGAANPEDAAACLELGACDYIAKPFDVESMVAMVGHCRRHS